MEDTTQQEAPAEQLDAGAQAPAEDTASSASEQPVDHRDDLAAGTTDTTEAPEFPERKFVSDEVRDQIQTSTPERIFVPGVGFVEVSHPE